MTYKVYETAQGSFAVDWPTCVQFIRSYHRSKLQLDCSREARESQSTINPLSWGLPDLFYVEVDRQRENNEIPSLVLAEAYRLGAAATFESKGIDNLVRELQRMKHQTQRYNTTFKDRMRSASQKSMRQIANSVETYQTAVEGAKIVRDLSGSILMGAATVVTGGGAGVAVAAAGTALKTTAKYQDTGSAGAAVVEASQQIVCTVIPIARGAKMGSAVKVVIGTVADTGKALLEGKSIGKAIAVGSVNLITGPAGTAAKSRLEGLLGKIAAPVIVKVVEDNAKKFVQGKIKKLGTNTSADIVPQGSDNEFSELAFEDELLLKLAIMDMSKGVGRSWW
jgi:hypothetical protein